MSGKKKSYSSKLLDLRPVPRGSIMQWWLECHANRALHCPAGHRSSPRARLGNNHDALGQEIAVSFARRDKNGEITEYQRGRGAVVGQILRKHLSVPLSERRY